MRRGTSCAPTTSGARAQLASPTSCSADPLQEVQREKVKLPKRSMKGAYDDQATLKGRRFIPAKY